MIHLKIDPRPQIYITSLHLSSFSRTHSFIFSIEQLQFVIQRFDDIDEGQDAMYDEIQDIRVMQQDLKDRFLTL